MFAIDIPTSALVGFVLADAAKASIKEEDPVTRNSLRKTVCLFNALFFTPVPLIFLNGWPGWQMNYVAPWADNLLSHPLRASVTLFFFIITVLPALLCYEIGRRSVLSGKNHVPRIGYSVMAGVIILIIILTRKATFNIAPTYAEYYAMETVKLWNNHPFSLLLTITTIYSWGALAVLCIKLKGGQHVRRNKRAG
jgi:hypothetical protein